MNRRRTFLALAVAAVVVYALIAAATVPYLKSASNTTAIREFNKEALARTAAVAAESRASRAAVEKERKLAQYQNCVSRNQGRAHDRQKWQYLFALIGPHQSAGIGRVIDKMRAYVIHSDKPFDCGKNPAPGLPLPAYLGG